MSELVKFPLEGGGTVMVEVEDGPGRQTMRGGRRGPTELAETAGETLESVLGRVGPAMHGIVEKLRSGGGRPDEVELEFGVKLSTDANVIIARAGGEANFRVTLRWSGE